MKTYIAITLSGILAVRLASGQGTIIWDESVNGPLSNDGSNPSLLGVLPSGTGSILGATQSQPVGNNWVVYSDFFNLTVPGGSLVSALTFASDRPVALWVGTDHFSTQLGYVVNPSNGDLLSQLGLASIGPGSLDMYVMNYDFRATPSTANYRLDFVSQSVPEPGSLGLLLVGVICLIVVRRWRKPPLTGHPQNGKQVNRLR
jgi:hypothetical protein